MFDNLYLFTKEDWKSIYQKDMSELPWLKNYLKRKAKKKRFSKTCLQKQNETREQLIDNYLNGFVCSPLRNFTSEEECLWQQRFSLSYYTPTKVNERLKDCQNYFNYIETAAHWKVNL